jgi:hypothetical protein
VPLFVVVVAVVVVAVVVVVINDQVIWIPEFRM